MRGQAEEQEQSLKVQEEEVHSKKRELDVLIEEEAKLNNDIKKSQREMESLVKSLSDVEKLLEEVGGHRCDVTLLTFTISDGWEVHRVRGA